MSPARTHVPFGWLLFDQPERRNAISVEMWEQLPEAVAAFASDDYREGVAAFLEKRAPRFEGR